MILSLTFLHDLQNVREPTLIIGKTDCQGISLDKLSLMDLYEWNTPSFLDQIKHYLVNSTYQGRSVFIYIEKDDLSPEELTELSRLLAGRDISSWKLFLPTGKELINVENIEIIRRPFNCRFFA